jgi:hypothetical protein
MHWFDRMSEQFAAVPTETTRRSVLRGTAVAAVVAPFAPGALAHANRWLRGSVAEEACSRCLGEAADELLKMTERCIGKKQKGAQLLPKAGGAKGGRGGKGSQSKKGAKAAESARRISCMSTAAVIYASERLGCQRRDCRGSHSPTAPPNVHPGEEGGGSGCPSGTTRCSGTLCCYGNDACCACATVEGGVVCCAAVIGCTCC